LWFECDVLLCQCVWPSGCGNITLMRMVHGSCCCVDGTSSLCLHHPLFCQSSCLPSPRSALTFFKPDSALAARQPARQPPRHYGLDLCCVSTCFD
jgi:hypothetical protein